MSNWKVEGADEQAVKQALEAAGVPRGRLGRWDGADLSVGGPDAASSTGEESLRLREARRGREVTLRVASFFVGPISTSAWEELKKRLTELAMPFETDAMAPNL